MVLLHRELRRQLQVSLMQKPHQSTFPTTAITTIERHQIIQLHQLWIPHQVHPIHARVPRYPSSHPLPFPLPPTPPPPPPLQPRHKHLSTRWDWAYRPQPRSQATTAGLPPLLDNYTRTTRGLLRSTPAAALKHPLPCRHPQPGISQPRRRICLAQEI